MSEKKEKEAAREAARDTVLTPPASSPLREPPPPTAPSSAQTSEPKREVEIEARVNQAARERELEDEVRELKRQLAGREAVQLIERTPSDYYAIREDGTTCELRESEIEDFIAANPKVRIFPTVDERSSAAAQEWVTRKMRVAQKASAKAKVEAQRAAFALRNPGVVGNEMIREASARGLFEKATAAGIDVREVLEKELREKERQQLGRR